MIDIIALGVASAIVEQGSNSTGTYIKFANGIMICHHRVELHAFSGSSQLTRSGFYEWTFPVPFAVAPASVCTCEVGFWTTPVAAGDCGGCNMASNNSIPATTVTGTKLYYNYTTYGGLVWFNGFAIGRWK